MNLNDRPCASELYASSLYRSLEGDPDKTRPVDWVGGMGFANELGRLIHRLRGHDASAFRPACHMLITRLERHNQRRGRVPPQILPALAAFVIRAHIVPNCPVCGGRGKLAVERDGSGENKIERDCHRCGGTGHKYARYHDFEGWGRVRADKAEEIFEFARGVVDRCDGYAERMAKMQVRWASMGEHEQAAQRRVGKDPRNLMGRGQSKA